MTTPFVSVIIPTYRRFEPLLRTLDDVLAQDYPNFEVIVADQNPEWPTELVERRRAAEWNPRVKWLAIESAGVVAARNRAVAASSGEILLFLDDDIFAPSRQLIARHSRGFEAQTVTAVVGRERSVTDPLPVSDSDDTSQPLPPPVHLTPLQQTLWFDRNGAARQWICTFCTCNSSVRRSAFLAVGGFDELFTGNSYGDDYDLALRLHAAGFSTVFDSSAWLVHRRAPIGGLRLTDGSNKTDAVATIQGLWLFVMRHGHRGMFRHLVFHHVLRKTVLLKRNLLRPWRQPAAIVHTLVAFGRARANLARGPRSRFPDTAVQA